LLLVLLVDLSVSTISGTLRVRSERASPDSIGGIEKSSISEEVSESVPSATQKSSSETPQKAPYAKLSPDVRNRLLDQVDRQVEAGTLKPEPPGKFD
jgi:hypothetical protein